MFKNFSIEDLSIIALLLEEEDQNKTKIKRVRRMAVHPNLKKRKLEGEYWTLYKELIDDEDKFFEYFRMNRYQFEILLNKIKPLITKQNTVFKRALSPKEKLAVCLRYLATGDSFISIAFSFGLGVSTVHNIVKEVCSAIIEQMMKETMPVPTREQWLRIAEEFWNTWNFPNCIGAIDGKLVVITAPANSRSRLLNNKKTISIILMAIVDADYKFICVDVGAYRENDDGDIFSNSNIGKVLLSNTYNVPENKNLPGTEISAPHVIVGDEAFPLKTYLMRPYPKSQLNDHRKNKFNDRLSHVRKIVKKAFGILAHKFRIYNKRIQLDPGNAEKVIMTTCILHNYINSGNAQSSINEEGASHSLSNLPRQSGNCQTAALNVRENFAKFFDSPEGALSY